MKPIGLAYGRKEVLLGLPEKTLVQVLEGKPNGHEKTEEAIIVEALSNPMGTDRLQDIVKAGQRVCLVISDVTRAWQKMSLYLPYIVEELNQAGILDENIIFLCATGSHRKQSREEHKLLLGEELALRFQVIDHDCRDESNLVDLGKTSFGTPVQINRIAMDCDHIIITGAIVYHDLVGWGGGKKSILPGIAGYQSIMGNHGLSLSHIEGAGTHPHVKSGNIVQNPLHEDMLEAAGIVNPSFLFNVMMDEAGNIGNAVAGHFEGAHEVGRKLVSESDGIFINEKADLVIASAGGFPKDMNLYQASKALSNGKEALKPGGTMILLCQCEEGFGHPEVQEIITGFESNLARETELRRNYTIAKYAGFLVTEIAAKYKVILVSEIDPVLLEAANIKVVSTLESALKLVGGIQDAILKTYVIPKAANVLPIVASDSN
ncbi:conserved hypothetical protein [Alkaliphilus metalliredigens QYMF]|uniref:Uncharacterized protein n=1 Tax=Alkaliphilus metalliredigens (strain QYMF) TaxID=293826 RepID=A6TKS3_ALKMQ|nr:nickel-dependent lactate racemase [Alkaliphilus metalliredigens]ABR46791.1 conserved hypothetical protein [Alkaliphilus metalliredigens QYMF]